MLEAMERVATELAGTRRMHALQWALARSDDELKEFFRDAVGRCRLTPGFRSLTPRYVSCVEPQM